MVEEDWDTEIENNSSDVPSTKFGSLSMNQNNSSPSSKYFEDDDFEKEKVSSQPQSFGRGFRSNRGYSRGSESRGGRGRGRGFKFSQENQERRDNSSNGFWRNNTPQNDRSQYNSNSQNDHLLRIEVNNDSVGKIIGKGGCKIKEIQSESGARIRVLSNDASLSATPVEITGSKDQQEKAHQMIKDLTIPAGDLQSWAAKENRNYEEKRANAPKIDWDQLKQDAERFEIERWADCPEIRKNFYREKKTIANMDPLQVAQIRMQKNNITVNNLSEDSKFVPNPVLTFEDAFEHYPEILDTIYDNKFTEPSPVQSQAWPVLLSGMDCIGIAQTGTGKTLAFLLPAFIHIDEQIVPRKQRGGPSCLVLSPTRELAQQIEMEVKKFHYRGIKSVCIYGGGDRREQIKLLQQGVEIVIGTPGRLNDLLMNGFFSVKSVTFLILDEADRMLDMGFEPEIKKILLDIRPDRQTVMTSATWLPGVQRIADRYLKNPVRVNVGSLDLQACHSVTQLVEFINVEDKQERVFEFIMSMGPTDKLIIFVGRKITADDISSNFAIREELPDIGIQCIHGDREQSDREQALADMKSGAARVLIATDVASRGLDIKDLTHVLNYDFPRHIEDYVHRVGRTGRAGRTGTALTFISREDWRHVGKLIPILVEAGQEVPDELHEMAGRWKEVQDRRDEEKNMAYGMGGGGRGGGGGGGGRGCFKCGKEGHFSRECPEGGGSGGRGGRGGGRGGRGRGGFGGGGFGGGGFGGGGFGGGGRRGGRGRDRESAIRIGSYDAI